MLQQYVRSVRIEQELEVIAAFAGAVTNLPQWTNFFVRVGETDGYRYQVETKMGSATTWIEQEQTEKGRRLAICSLFGERRETAYVDLEEHYDITEVQFRIYLPAEWPKNRVECQLSQLQEELLILKTTLEGSEKKIAHDRYDSHRITESS